MKTERKKVGVPFSVVLKPSLADVVGVWAAVNERIVETSAEAWRKLVRAMIAGTLCSAVKEQWLANPPPTMNRRAATEENLSRRSAQHYIEN